MASSEEPNQGESTDWEELRREYDEAFAAVPLEFKPVIAARLALRVLPVSVGYIKRFPGSRSSNYLQSTTRAAFLAVLGEKLASEAANAAHDAYITAAKAATIAATAAAAAYAAAKAVIDTDTGASSAAHAADAADGFSKALISQFFFGCSIADMRTTPSLRRGVVQAAFQSLWPSEFLSGEVIQFVNQWLAEVRRARLVELASLYEQYAFRGVDESRLRAYLSLESTSSETSLSNPGIESGAQTNTQPREVEVLVVEPLDESLQDARRWATLIFRLCLLNSEKLSALQNPQSDTFCSIVAEGLQSLASESGPLTNLGSENSPRAKSPKKRSVSALPDQEKVCYFDLLTRLETHAMKRLSREADSANSSFLPPELWISWLSHIHADTMKQFYSDVCRVLSGQEAPHGSA